METPAWILVFILSITLFLFLLVGIILLIKLIGVTKEAKKIMLQGQNIAEKADDIADNVRDMTTVGGLVKYFTESYLEKAEKKGLDFFTFAGIKNLEEARTATTDRAIVPTVIEIHSDEKIHCKFPAVLSLVKHRHKGVCTMHRHEYGFPGRRVSELSIVFQLEIRVDEGWHSHTNHQEWNVGRQVSLS